MAQLWIVRQHGAFLKMLDRRTRHLQRMNALGQLVGILFIVIGGIVFLSALAQGDWLAICFTALAPIFGILLLCAKPYRAHGGDSASSKSADRHETD